MKSRKQRRGFIRLNVVTSCISTTLVLVLLGTIVFFVTMASNLSDALRENFTVSLMLDDDIPQAEAYKLQTELRKLPCARLVTYISKERALREQSQAMGSDPSEFLGTNPIPASFELHLKADYANNDSLVKILPHLKRSPYVVEVAYPHELMKSLNDNIRRVSMLMLIVAVLLMFVSFELINNTVRLSVYSRRFLIHTMKLVGASWGFIRRPFLRRAFWVGVFSAILASGVLVGGIQAMLTYEPQMYSIITWDVVAATVGVVFGCGILLTILCAYFSVNKHLRMKSDDLYMM